MACVLLVNITMFIIAIRIAKNSMQKRGESNDKTLALMKGMLYYVIMINVDVVVHIIFYKRSQSDALQEKAFVVHVHTHLL